MIPNTKHARRELDRMLTLLRANEILTGSSHGFNPLTRELKGVEYAIGRAVKHLNYHDEEVKERMVNPLRCSDYDCEKHGELLVYDKESEGMICPSSLEVDK